MPPAFGLILIPLILQREWFELTYLPSFYGSLFLSYGHAKVKTVKSQQRNYPHDCTKNMRFAADDIPTLFAYTILYLSPCLAAAPDLVKSKLAMCHCARVDGYPDWKK